MKVKKKLKKMNELYHQIINNTSGMEEERYFRQLALELKKLGYQFKVGIPTTDFLLHELDNSETILFIRLEVVRMLKSDAIVNKLFSFAGYMRDTEKHLLRAIYISLCKRRAIKPLYFQVGDTQNISFFQSGHPIDIYPIF